MRAYASRPDGASASGHWNQSGEDWSFTKTDGSYARDEWMALPYNGETYWYFFDEGGQLVTGWIDWNGARYYLIPVSDGWKGRMLTGWQLIDGKWYYFETVAGSNQGHLYVNTTTPDGYQVGADSAWIQ